MFDLASKQGKYMLNVNGASYKAQQTLLLNDLGMYQGEVEAGANVETVLLFEVPAETVSEIGNMELSIEVGDKVNTMLLQGGSVTANTSETQNNEDVSDLAEEYEAALLEEEQNALEESSETEEEETQNENDGGNVTVIGGE